MQTRPWPSWAPLVIMKLALTPLERFCACDTPTWRAIDVGEMTIYGASDGPFVIRLGESTMHKERF